MVFDLIYVLHQNRIFASTPIGPIHSFDSGLKHCNFDKKFKAIFSNCCRKIVARPKSYSLQYFFILYEICLVIDKTVLIGHMTLLRVLTIT